MTEQELIEAVARRLVLAVSILGDDRPYMIDKERWHKAAREAIRLMEWARHECAHEVWVGDPDDRRIAEFRPLTLPPDDWNP